MNRALRVLVVLSVLLSIFGFGVTAVSAQGDGPAMIVYVVQWGDYLASIARQYGTTVDAIVSANGFTNPNLIFPGQRIFVPVGYNPVPNPNPGTGGPYAYHVVQPGENLFRIGLLYGVTPQAIAAANGITNIRIVYIGQVLTIPPAQQQPAPRPVTYYTVQWGDYLSVIAARFGTTLGAIMAANNITNPNFIYPGQVLVIP